MLQGDPSLPFRQRFLITTAPACNILDCLAVASMGAIWHRSRPYNLPSFVDHCILATAAASLAGIVWRWRCRGAAHGGSYAKYCEPLIAFLRIYGYGFGAGAVWGRVFLDEAQATAGSGTFAVVRHFVLLLVASGAMTSPLLWGRPLLISLAAPIQLGVSVHFSRFTPTLCAAASLSSPMARRLTQRALAALSLPHRALLFLSTGRGGRGAPDDDPSADCRVVLTFLQLGLGFVLPALAQVVVEGRMLRQHQRERQRAGLPPERGLHARLHAVLGDLLTGVDQSLAWLCALGLFSWTWTCSVLLAGAWHEVGPSPREHALCNTVA